MFKLFILMFLFCATTVSATTLQWDYTDTRHEGFVMYRAEVNNTLYTEIGRTDKDVRVFTDEDESKIYCYFVKAYAGNVFSVKSNTKCVVPSSPFRLRFN